MRAPRLGLDLRPGPTIACSLRFSGAHTGVSIRDGTSPVISPRASMHEASELEGYWHATLRRPRPGLGDHERAAAVVESDRRGGARFDRLDECVELLPVGLGVTVDEKVQQRIAAQAVLAVALERRRRVVARDQHAFLAESLDALVVAVYSAEAGVDVHQRALGHPQHD